MWPNGVTSTSQGSLVWFITSKVKTCIVPALQMQKLRQTGTCLALSRLAGQGQASCTNHHCQTPTVYNEPIGILFALVNYKFIKRMGFISSIMQRIYKVGEASTQFATRHQTHLANQPVPGWQLDAFIHLPHCHSLFLNQILSQDS